MESESASRSSTTSSSSSSLCQGLKACSLVVLGHCHIPLFFKPSKTTYKKPVESLNTPKP